MARVDLADEVGELVIGEAAGGPGDGRVRDRGPSRGDRGVRLPAPAGTGTAATDGRGRHRPSGSMAALRRGRAAEARGAAGGGAGGARGQDIRRGHRCRRKMAGSSAGRSMSTGVGRRLRAARFPALARRPPSSGGSIAAGWCRRRCRWPARSRTSRRRPRAGWGAARRRRRRRRRSASSASGAGGGSSTSDSTPCRRAWPPADRPSPRGGARESSRSTIGGGGRRGHARGTVAAVQGAQARHELRVAGSEGQRLQVLRARARAVAEAFEALAQEALGQDVVGGGLQHRLQLGARRLQVSALQESAAQGQPKRGIGGRLLDAFTADADRLRELARLAQLLRQLPEHARARILLQALPQLFDARVGRGAGAGSTCFSAPPARAGRGEARERPASCPGAGAAGGGR